MSYNVPDALLANLLGVPFSASRGNMAIVDQAAPPLGSVGEGSVGEGGPDGTLSNPYRTIQEAIDATPTPVFGDVTTWIRQIVVFPGVYDENLVITQPNIMTIYTLGFVIVSGSIPVGPIAPADYRYLVYNVTDSPVPAASLTIVPLDTYPGYRSGAERFWISRNIVLGGDAGDPVNSERALVLRHVRANAINYSSGSGSVGDPDYVPKLEGKIGAHMQQCTLDDGMKLPDDLVRYQIIWEDVRARILEVGAGPGSVGGDTDSNLKLIRCAVAEHVICPEARWDLCQDTEIGEFGSVGVADSEMWSYDRVENSTFYNGLTIHSASLPYGAFVNSIVYDHVTASANVFRLDPITNWYINDIGTTVAAGVRKLIHDETIT